MTSHPASVASDEDFFQAFEFALPVYEMAKLRWRALHDPTDPARTGLNAYWHQQSIATADDRWVTTPNIDTLYSVAWVDLSQGPVRVRIPACDGRYVNLAMLDMYSNNVEWLSQRDVGNGGAELTVVGPHWRGELERDLRVVHAPYDDILLFARTLVDDQSDTPAAREVQQGFTVSASLPVTDERAPARSDDVGEDFFSLAGHALRRNPPRAHEAAIETVLTRVGLMGEPDEASLARWRALVPGFLQRLRQRVPRFNVPVDHWIQWPANMGDFGTSYGLRATVALGGLLALPRSEACYTYTEFDAQDRELHGQNVYCLVLPAEGVPADAFWSLTLYEKMPTGARFLAHNPLGRHAFTSRSRSLNTSDGKLVIWVSHRRPPPEFESNWLPAPDAPFRLSLRAYHPSPDLLAGRWQVAAVQRAEDFGVY
ncbi:MAG: DUF1254 domain-containing protein [Burkholderiaceae bacterium]